MLWEWVIAYFAIFCVLNLSLPQFSRFFFLSHLSSLRFFFVVVSPATDQQAAGGNRLGLNSWKNFYPRALGYSTMLSLPEHGAQKKKTNKKMGLSSTKR